MNYINLTNSQEEYLKTIYILSKKEKEVRVTDIANKLKITKPSVNKAINNLNKINLINYQTYGNITLTEKGKEIAKAILKKFDIVKLFLTQVLEVDEKVAEEEAKSMKYAISEKTQESLEKYIIKILNLEELECGCNINNEKCRNCARIKQKDKEINKEIKK